MKTIQILLVEDDEEICEILQFYLLEKADYNVSTVHTAEQALALISVRNYDLVLMDINLPGMDGIDLCARIRTVSDCPIIFISCINDDETIIRALNMGGDDYLVKPFHAPILIARIEANLRRIKPTVSEEKILRAGELELDTAQRLVKKGGKPVRLSPTEYELLHYLMSNKGRFVSFDDVYQAVWQRPSLGDTRALFVHISHLRQKIEDDPSKPLYVATHLRDGYIFTEGSGKIT